MKTVERTNLRWFGSSPPVASEHRRSIANNRKFWTVKFISPVKWLTFEISTFWWNVNKNYEIFENTISVLLFSIYFELFFEAFPLFATVYNRAVLEWCSIADNYYQNILLLYNKIK